MQKQYNILIRSTNSAANIEYNNHMGFVRVFAHFIESMVSLLIVSDQRPSVL